MSKQEHLKQAVIHEMLIGRAMVARWPEFLDGEWRDVTDALMALYHYVLAYAPQEEE